MLIANSALQTIPTPLTWVACCLRRFILRHGGFIHERVAAYALIPCQCAAFYNPR